MLEKIGDVYQLSTTGIPTDNQMVDTWDTQDRLGKDIYNTCAPQDGERVQFDQMMMYNIQILKRNRVK